MTVTFVVRGTTDALRALAVAVGLPEPDVSEPDDAGQCSVVWDLPDAEAADVRRHYASQLDFIGAPFTCT